jgi:drug/metabolite transporter (DMT)-like permease
MTHRQSLRRGAAFMILSALFFAVMGLCVKVAAHSLSNAAVVFARNFFGLLALLPWLRSLGFRGLRSTRPGEHLVRSVAGLAAMYCFFYAIAHMRLADAVLLNYSLPLFMPFIAWFWLGEPIPQGLWQGLVLGFAGIALILKPGSGLFQPVALMGVASAALAAVAQVGVRRLTRTEPVTRIVFYFSVISTALSVLPVLGRWSLPEPRLFALLLFMGVVATVAQLLLTRAYALAPAAQVGPFIYACVPFAALLDGLVLKQWPDSASVLGSLLVGSAGILVLRKDRRPASVPATAP